MVLLQRITDMDDSMPQIVPSAGFTPPCDYSTFAENFDLSLLPGGESPLSPSTLLYTQSPPPSAQYEKLKIFTTYYPISPVENSKKNNDVDLSPDFQKLLPQTSAVQSDKQNLYPPSPTCSIYLEVPSSQNYHANSPTGALSPYSPQSLLSPNEQLSIYSSGERQNFYTKPPDVSPLYTPTQNSYSNTPREDYLQTQFIKKENTYPDSPYPHYNNIKEESYLSPCSNPTGYPNSSSSNQRITAQIENSDVFELLESTLLDKQIKQESTVDFSNLLQTFNTTNENLRELIDETYKTTTKPSQPEKSAPQDHQLLREVLRDTSFQKKYNIKPIDFGFLAAHIKMEEPDEHAQKELMSSEQLARENIEPVLNLAIEQMRKDVDTTCAALSISADPSQWTSANALSWLQWTSREFGLPSIVPDQWEMAGPELISLTEEEFTKRMPQGGSILHAQLEIWKAARLEEDMSMQWMPETTSSNASSGGDMSDDEEEEQPPSQSPEVKPSTSRASGGSHIHLWQFLKELLASPQVYGSCIRWLDRSKGVFKIEDSVKVARLWGKRKNRPAMNYDKLSRSIRQYYKKGIMKKTERSQRLVYQFCHPYSL